MCKLKVGELLRSSRRWWGKGYGFVLTLEEILNYNYITMSTTPTVLEEICENGGTISGGAKQRPVEKANWKIKPRLSRKRGNKRIPISTNLKEMMKKKIKY